MKKVLLASLCLSTGFLSNAQISKGSVLLGGGISASKGKSESGVSSSKSNGFSFRPSLGFAVKDNQVLGFTVGYGRGKTKYENSTTVSESNNYDAGVFYRRYLPLSKAFYLFGEADFGYHHYKTENDIPASGYKHLQEYTSIGLSLFPGVTYVVSKKFHLEASINNLLSLHYSKGNTEQSSLGNTQTSEDKGVSLNASVSASSLVSLGFRFVLGK